MPPYHFTQVVLGSTASQVSAENCTWIDIAALEEAAGGLIEG